MLLANDLVKRLRSVFTIQHRTSCYIPIGFAGSLLNTNNLYPTKLNSKPIAAPATAPILAHVLSSKPRKGSTKFTTKDATPTLMSIVKTATEANLANSTLPPPLPPESNTQNLFQT